jgi:hypothetical protein
MADTVYIDLATLEHVFQKGLDAGLHALDGCVPEISVSAEVLAAIRAGKFGGIDRVVGPSEFRPASFTTK